MPLSLYSVFNVRNIGLAENHLSKLVLMWRQSTEKPSSRWYGLRDESPGTLTSLAKRHKWSIVPELAFILSGETYSAFNAAFGLTEMGVYQASASIEKAMQSSTKWLGDDSVKQRYRVYIQAVNRVELSGSTTDIISPELLQVNERYMPEDSAFYDHLSDLLCEVDSHQPPAEWSTVQKLVLRDDYGDNDRYDAIKRGLRKWGPTALTQLFDLDDMLWIQRYIGYIRDLIGVENAHTRDIFVQAAKEIMEDRHTYHDDLFLSWLKHTKLPLRLWGLYGLVFRRVPIPMETLSQLFTEDDEVLVSELIRFASAIPTMHDILQSMSQKSPYFTTPTESFIAEKTTHHLIEQINDGDPQALKLLAVYRMPQFDSLVLQMLHPDNPSLSQEFLEAAAEIDTLSGNNSLRRGFLSLLQCEDENIYGTAIIHLLQIKEDELGEHLASLLRSIDEEKTEKAFFSMFGIALIAYDGATQDVLSLVQHPIDEVRLTSIATCAALGLANALPKLRENTEILIQQIAANKENSAERSSNYLTDNIANFRQDEPLVIDPFEGDFRLPTASPKDNASNTLFVSREPDSELIAIQFTRAVLGDSIPFTYGIYGEMLYVRIGEGVIGFQALSTLSEKRSLSMRLSGSQRFDWLFSIPHFWQRLVSLDLEQISWLDSSDSQVLLASLPLIQIRVYFETDRISLVTLPQPEEALDQFCCQLGVENRKEYVTEQIARTVYRLANDLIGHMAKSPIVNSATPTTFLVVEDLFFSSNKKSDLSWELIEEDLRKIAISVYTFLIEDMAPPLPVEFASLANLLLFGENVVELLLEDKEKILLTGTPDTDFFTALKEMGWNISIFQSIYEWGYTLIETLQMVYQDSELGSDYLNLWTMRLAAIDPDFQYREDRLNENGRYQKQNPLAFMFEPFRQT